MRNVQIRNVPDRVHRVLVRRARERGQSLQEYMLELLEGETSQPTMEEWIRRVESRTGGKIGLEEAARIIREERDAPDRG
ncbi:MAG: FitA-like ribbon-helix-helix domain-containing protein [Actinomycetota bacterium]